MAQLAQQSVYRTGQINLCVEGGQARKANVLGSMCLDAIAN